MSCLDGLSSSPSVLYLAMQDQFGNRGPLQDSGATMAIVGNESRTFGDRSAFLSMAWRGLSMLAISLAVRRIID